MDVYVYTALLTYFVLVKLDVLEGGISPPAWSQGIELTSVSELAPIGTAITVTTTASNSPDTVTILPTSIGTNATTLFNVTTDGTNVQLSTAGALDRETTNAFELYLRASNAGGDTSTEANFGDLHLIVGVEDINDNRPVFKPETKCKEMANGSTASTSIETMTATDADSCPHSLGDTPYSFAVNQDQFEIVSRSGEVKVASGLSSGLAAGSYNLLINAWDVGSPSLIGQGTLTVCVGLSCCSTCSGGCGVVNNGGNTAVHEMTFQYFIPFVSLSVLKLSV